VFLVSSVEFQLIYVVLWSVQCNFNLILAVVGFAPFQDTE
jgi:hypothetical protein